MNTKIAMSVLVGAALGAAAVQGLHAQVKRQMPRSRRGERAARAVGGHQTSLLTQTAR
jgi:hypothetical protein